MRNLVSRAGARCWRRAVWPAGHTHREHTPGRNCATGSRHPTGSFRPGSLGIDESKADEVTAYLRPNPDLTVGVDQVAPFQGNPYRPFGQRCL